jgi:hypothetical protein
MAAGSCRWETDHVRRNNFRHPTCVSLIREETRDASIAPSHVARKLSVSSAAHPTPLRWTSHAPGDHLIQPSFRAHPHPSTCTISCLFGHLYTRSAVSTARSSHRKVIAQRYPSRALPTCKANLPKSRSPETLSHGIHQYIYVVIFNPH